MLTVVLRKNCKAKKKLLFLLLKTSPKLLPIFKTTLRLPVLQQKKPLYRYFIIGIKRLIF